jgi:HAD superfamily hydrolase (TIGR01509 family)
MRCGVRSGSRWWRFFPPILGGTPKAWAAANGIVARRQLEQYTRTMYGRVDADYAAWDRADRIAWTAGMCELVGVEAPPEEECIALSHRAADFITRRVRSAYPGAVDAIRELHARGTVLYTASGEYSGDLAGYLEGMGVRHCFQRLYGPDLVNRLKEGPAYYTRIFADAGVAPAEAMVVDDKSLPLTWAAQAGARTVRVVAAEPAEATVAAGIGSLAELPRVIERL